MNRQMRFLEPMNNFRVVPMNPRMSGDVPRIERAISRGLAAHPDPDRDNFYSLDLDGSWFYVHVHEGFRKVYLLAAGRDDAAAEAGRSAGYSAMPVPAAATCSCMPCC